MDIEKIEKFIDAGYTKTEIEAMEKGDGGGEQGGETTGANVTTPDKKSGDGVQTDAGEVNAEALAAMVKTLTASVDSLKETVKSIQSANVNAASVDSNTDNKISDVMKSFIDTL